MHLHGHAQQSMSIKYGQALYRDLHGNQGSSLLCSHSPVFNTFETPFEEAQLAMLEQRAAIRLM